LWHKHFLERREVDREMLTRPREAVTA
jgi:hypothetical protein